ncbi:hypothetical protein HMPREF0645_2231 [Hallella bergensis DSM 17361]|uniref:Uncharacterized protein n=1 Tax=Hallella bergensis DSM 17361 TaxID=585502 RepID=D1PZ46_9BACT|nr:hypothetical protein HMPREF0645_2231 [Hallella bergensis DSM 17361]
MKAKTWKCKTLVVFFRSIAFNSEIKFITLLICLWWETVTLTQAQYRKYKA